MNLWIALIAAGALLEEGGSSAATTIALDIQKVAATLAREEGGGTLIEKGVEVESNRSVNPTVDKEIATLIQSIPVEEVAPVPEDSSQSAKGEVLTIVGVEASETQNAYEKLLISAMEKQKIGNLLITMADNNVFQLLFEKKRLEKLGREINHVHPIRFLGAVFSDPSLVNCMYEIRRSGFKWDGFIDGFSQRFKEELHNKNIEAYIPGFAASLGLEEKNIMSYVKNIDFEGLVLHLMENKKR
jgi:hypothetical protein